MIKKVILICLSNKLKTKGEIIMANKGIDNEEELIKLFKLIMLLHDVGKPNCKKINQKTGFDSFIKHEKESEEIADYILSDSFIYKKLVLWFIKNHEYINENTCTNKNSISKSNIHTFLIPFPPERICYYAA